MTYYVCRMPAKSARQYGMMQAACRGKSTKAKGLSREKACEFIHKTPAGKRRGFAREMRRGC